jgi:L,D-transpeptidase ErfK/SrfK
VILNCSKAYLNFLRLLVIVSCLLYLPKALAQPLSFTITGGIFEYEVQSGDNLTKIGARYGVAAKVLASENKLINEAILIPKQTLTIDNRHIVPVSQNGDLLINLPQRMLYYFNDGELVAAYPVGLGKPSWPTPIGNFMIASKIANKTWLVPRSIQEEMHREGKAVITEVPPGPSNPLGRYWLGLSLSGIGIHGTIAPASIYRFQSHGCIRLHPDDIEALFTQVGKALVVILFTHPY